MSGLTLSQVLILAEHPGAVLRLQAEDSRGLRGEQQDLLPPGLYEGTVSLTDTTNSHDLPCSAMFARSL